MAGLVDLQPLFYRQFQLSRVNENEVVAVLSTPSTRREYVDAALAASHLCGAEVVQVTVPDMGWKAPGIVRRMAMGVPAVRYESSLLKAIRGLLMNVDFIVDLIPETILHIPLREELLEAKKRILTVVEAPDALERLFPTPEIKNRVLRMRRILEKAKTLHVTTPAGTDVHYELIPGSGIAQYGYADEPGHWDNWPSALVSSYPVEGKVNGVVVIDVGDIIFPFGRYAQNRVILTIEDGYIRKIEGGLEAELMRDFLERWNEPELFAVSHIGFGLHPRAQWSALDFYAPSEIIGMDARSINGGFIFSTGPSRYVGRWSEVHFDICMRNVTTELDGEVVLRNGKFVIDLEG